MCDDVDYVEMRNDPPHLTIDFGGESFQDLTRAASWPKLCNTICSVIQERSTLCASNCISNLYFASKGKRFSETILLFDDADVAPIQRKGVMQIALVVLLIKFTLAFKDEHWVPKNFI